MHSPFLNVDAGELMEEPEALYALAHVANIACGGHAGDDATMLRSVDRCMAHGTRIGVHPSYPDRANFGRRTMPLSELDLYATVREQCDRLNAWVTSRGQRIEFAKAHGALYHDIDRTPLLAEAFMRAVVDALGTDLTAIGPPRGSTLSVSMKFGLRFAAEAFADRRRTHTGALVPRTEPNALIEDANEAADVVRTLAASVDTVCVHSDTANAVSIASRVRTELDAMKLRA